ncbi:16S rRNA (cytidine(1402)-2'-O)-methyltransferase [Biformimicrobium ophioploci]|uniref:Ribosomal RNA small subunit methyltransferase I n=1 Tax=Biformimicrobium ophioploci TaxID=3036711 RepID=A0ABQ6LX43_9GAMM|nr:16S rRNA (cytidine(1402)-2'-O)-methyltransferase [Microbulbifer sp. NKW57]GMG86633.1 16S rRNA (cytidine(1402)-2'-O)-methyltransferase [Microbulbifer sp. NKW57]
MLAENALYIVATPVGNLGDMTPRAVDVLAAVDMVAAEDTRHSQRLFAHFEINTPLAAYHDHSGEGRVDWLLQKLHDGGSVALISDAGTPLISDPGYRIVRRAREQGIKVIPVPGACAFVAALSAAGLPSDRFSFEGFLAAKPGTRRNQLEKLAADTRTLVFYEAPHRVADTLAAMAEVFGAGREAVIARELTKAFETIHFAPLAELAAWVAADSNQQRGEIVLLVRGAPEPGDEGLDPESIRIMEILRQELPVKQAAKLASEITGVRKKTLYQWAIEKE